MRKERLAATVLSILAACGGAGSSGIPAPVPRSVVPSAGYTGRTTAVRITGDNFLARPDAAQLDIQQRAWMGDTELADVTWIDAQTLSATVPAEITPGVKTLKVENAYGRQGTLAAAYTARGAPAGLSATIATGRPTADIAQAIDVSFTVSNGGTGPASVTAVVPSTTGSAAACGAVSPAPPVALGVGASQVFTWSCAGSAEGTLVIDGSAAGTDVTTDQPLSASAVAADQVVVQAPAALAAAVSVDGNLSAVTVGQAFMLTLAVSNPGGAAATVTALAVTPLEAGCGAPAPAMPQTVAGGAAGVIFTFPCAAIATGSLAPAVSVRGQAANTGGLLTAAATLVPALAVQAPAALTAAIAGNPTTLGVGQTTNLTFTVTNGTGSLAVKVTSLASWSTGSGAAICSGASVSAGITIQPGAAQSFAWTCTATAPGYLLMGGTLNFTVGKTPASASPAVPLAVTVTR
jgi:hypothetical protein